VDVAAVSFFSNSEHALDSFADALEGFAKTTG
jgi:hypothetical protein